MPSTARGTSSDNEANARNINKQNVDDTYCAYVYSLIAKHPSIVIGTVPEGSPPVWIAPPHNKKSEMPPPPPISLNPVEDGKSKSMAELITEYGGELKIAADKATCFLMLTGSHSRVSLLSSSYCLIIWVGSTNTNRQPPKLSDTVYTTLQIVTRTREKGVPIKDLGPMTGYDPKSIFYQISQLIDMNLV